MPVCKFCQKPFSWGLADGKWVPLVPVGEEGELDRAYQDENGVLRAEHRAVCLRQGGPTVRVARLAKAVPAKDVMPSHARVEAAQAETVGQTIDRIRAKKRAKKDKTP